MIPLEKQVTCRELSQKLKELGIKQNSVWYWIITSTTNYHLSLVDGDKRLLPKDRNDWYSAFTVSELGEILPSPLEVEHEDVNAYYYLHSWKTMKSYVCEYLFMTSGGEIQKYKTLYYQIGDTMADAMATMLIYLIQHNIIKAGDLR